MGRFRLLTGAFFIAAGSVYLQPGVAHGAQQSPGQAVTIATVSDGPFARFGDLAQQLRDEVTELLSVDFEVTFTPETQYAGDWTLAGVEGAVDGALADPDVDLVIAVGPVGSQILASRAALPKPAVAAFILAPRLQGLPTEESTGVANLNYLYARREGRTVELLNNVAGFRRLAILVPRALTETIPDMAERVRSLSEDAGVQSTSPPDIVPVGASAGDALAEIDADVQAVLVLPLLELGDVEFDRLAQGLIARRLPSFSWFGEREVRAGLLAGATPEGFARQFLRWIGLNVQQILLGADAGELPVSFPAQERLAINMTTADAIGVSPRWSVLITAELIGLEEQRAARRLSLDRALSEAIEVNLDLAARERFVAAGADNVRLATSSLLPQLSLGADWSVIDEDRAESLMGARPERVLSGGATLSQLVFDERAWAGRSIEESVQESRVFDQETLRLDIARDAGVAYLNVLRAKTFERIARDNLGVTRTNLELARLRVSTGAASLAEVYRWQAQIANDQGRVVDGEVSRSVSELQVNRILHRPLEERFDTDEATLTDPALRDLLARLEPYIDNPRDFEIFRGFMTQEALDIAPELGQLDALTAAQERQLQSASRSFFLPTVALQADLATRLAEGGAGSDITGPTGIETDDVTWSAALVLSYPLFAGASRFAARDQASKEVTRLQLERDAAAERIEQRVRAALHLMRGSLINIELSRNAAEAADNNFRLTQDAYRRGVGDILDVLDAQNEALTANEAAASAVYDFLIDLIEVQRAAGRFEYFSSPQDRAAFLDRLDAFFQQAGTPQN